MTSEERERLNSLAVDIQGEMDYERFAAQAREICDLIERKARRFGHTYGRNCRPNRASRTLPAVVQRIVQSMHPDQSEKVEVLITEAEELFREIRIANRLTGPDGESVSLKQGIRVEVTLEAEMQDTTHQF